MKEKPLGVKVITYATAIRWFGWGFAESLIPVFIFSFSHSYAQAGLISSVYTIFFILTLPIAGMAADKFRSTSIILLGLALYAFVGLSYLLAGVTGLVVYILIARGLNGITYGMDSVGRETYFMRYVPHNALASVFGYFDSIANLWWVIASVIGIFLIKYLSISTLLFLITPTSLIAFIVVWFFRKNEQRIETVENKSHFTTAYAEAFTEIIRWDWNLRMVAMFSFFISLASSVVSFFLPIEAYENGANFQYVLLIGIMFALPYLLGWLLGKWFDIQGIKSFFYGLLGMSILFFLLAFLQGHVWQIIIAFGISLIVELLILGTTELTGTYAEPEHLGRISGVMTGINNVGVLVGPLIAGIMIDSYGTITPYITLSILTALLAIIFSVFEKRFSKKEMVPIHLHEKLHRIR